MWGRYGLLGGFVGVKVVFLCLLLIKFCLSLSCACAVVIVQRFGDIEV